MTTQPGQTALHLHRPGGFRDYLRGYQVFVDQVRVGTLRRNQELTVPLLPGHHVLEAKIDWTGGVPLTVEVRPGECVSVQVGPAPVARAVGGLFASSGYLALTVDGSVTGPDGRPARPA